MTRDTPGVARPGSAPAADEPAGRSPLLPTPAGREPASGPAESSDCSISSSPRPTEASAAAAAAAPAPATPAPPETAAAGLPAALSPFEQAAILEQRYAVQTLTVAQRVAELAVAKAELAVARAEAAAAEGAHRHSEVVAEALAVTRAAAGAAGGRPDLSARVLRAGRDLLLLCERMEQELAPSGASQQQAAGDDAAPTEGEAEEPA